MRWIIVGIVLVTLVAIVPWEALSGPDAAFVAFALAPPLLLGLLLGLRQAPRTPSMRS